MRGRGFRRIAVPSQFQPPSDVKTYPSPVGGWNTRDPVDVMKTKYAITIDNWMVVPGGYITRKGKLSYATGITGGAKSLMVYSPPSGSDKMFVASPTDIYNVSATGAVGAADVSSLISGAWQSVMQSNSGASVMIAVNGADTPRYYDGTWHTAGITGTGLSASSNLIGLWLHKERVWFVEKDSLNVWYLATSAIIGTATKFPMQGIFKLGGYVVAGGTISRDGGRGTDDYWVAITNKGEVAVYSGTDPASASTWALVGVYKISEPIGRRCAMQLGSDLAVLTKIGVITLSTVMSIAQSGQVNSSITDAISPSFVDAAINSGFSHWSMIEAPSDHLVLVNIPQSSTMAHQYVFSAETGAWFRFKNFDALCWGLFNNELYFGDNGGKVWKYTGELDDGAAVASQMQWAFTDLGYGGEKTIEMVRASMQAPAQFNPQFSIKADYDTSAPVLNTTAFTETGTPWGSPWGSPWSVPTRTISKWVSAAGHGRAVSVAFSLRSTKRLRLNAIDIMYGTGSYLA